MKKSVVFVALAMALLAIPAMGLASDTTVVRQGQAQDQFQQQRADADARAKARATSSSDANINNVNDSPRQFNQPPVIIHPIIPSNGPYNGGPRYNDMTREKADVFVSCFTMENYKAFISGLSEKDRKDLEKADKKIREGTYMYRQLSRKDDFVRFLGDGPPPGIEGKDYLLVSEINMSAESLDIQALVFKFLVAQSAWDQGGNAFSLISFGSDPEQKSGGWGIGFYTNQSTVSGGYGQSSGGGTGIARHWNKEKSRPWIYAAVYYIPRDSRIASVLEPCIPPPPSPAPVVQAQPPAPPKPKPAPCPPSLFSEVERVKQGLAECKTLGENNFRLHVSQLENYVRLAACVGSESERRRYLELASREYEYYEYNDGRSRGSVVKNYGVIEEPSVEVEELKRKADYLESGILFELQGEARARTFAQEHGIMSIPRFARGF